MKHLCLCLDETLLVLLHNLHHLQAQHYVIIFSISFLSWSCLQVIIYTSNDFEFRAWKHARFVRKHSHYQNLLVSVHLLTMIWWMCRRRCQRIRKHQLGNKTQQTYERSFLILPCSIWWWGPYIVLQLNILFITWSFFSSCILFNQHVQRVRKHVQRVTRKARWWYVTSGLRTI